MATILDVVNDCLASMGEAPLASLTEPHEFKGAAQRTIDRTNRRIQATGWWCNQEAVTYVPNSVNGQVQLPGDVLKFQSGVRNRDLLQRGVPKPWIVQRGSRLYDTRTRSYVITEAEVIGEITRNVPFEDLPPVLNEYIAAEAVLKFQSNFDADNGKRQELEQAWSLARQDARAEQIRQVAVNLRNNNASLSRIKSYTRSARRYIGR